MKKRKIGYVLLYCILAVMWGLLIASLFTGCNIYEKERIEVIRSPVVDVDTLQIPDWENQN